ncbi:MAG: carbohydrate binding domain-containing protein [Chloroflexi bacterium]|nr:carbohydrate binding domain-containing protein [Chloroflexota bacterium]
MAKAREVCQRQQVQASRNFDFTTASRANIQAMDGRWSFDDGQLVGESPVEPSFVFLNQGKAAQCMGAISIETRLAIETGRWGGLLFGVKDRFNFYGASIDASDGLVVIEKTLGGKQQRLATMAVFARQNEPHLLRVIAYNLSPGKVFIQIYLDGEMMGEYMDSSAAWPVQGGLGLGIGWSKVSFQYVTLGTRLEEPERRPIRWSSEKASLLIFNPDELRRRAQVFIELSSPLREKHLSVDADGAQIGTFAIGRDSTRLNFEMPLERGENHLNLRAVEGGDVPPWPGAARLPILGFAFESISVGDLPSPQGDIPVKRPIPSHPLRPPDSEAHIRTLSENYTVEQTGPGVRLLGTSPYGRAPLIWSEEPGNCLWKTIAQVKFRVLEGLSAGVMFGVQDENNFYLVELNVKEGVVALDKFIEGKGTSLRNYKIAVEADAWHEIKVRAQSNYPVATKLELYLDGNAVGEYEDTEFVLPMSASWGLSTARATALFDLSVSGEDETPPILTFQDFERGWDQWISGSERHALLKRGDAHSGQMSLRMTGAKGALAVNLVSPAFEVREGKSYVVSGWVKVKSGVGAFKMAIHWGGSDGEPIGWGANWEEWTGDRPVGIWTPVSVTVPAPAEAVKARLYVGVADGSDMLFDDIKVEER